jgi:ribonuclease-3
MMQELEKELNYTFRNPALLGEALSHSSYANEHRAIHLNSNERLEFLGDSVLGFVTAEFLFTQHPNLPEGDLTRIRAALVCEESLNEAAQSLRLGDYLKLGRGEESGGGRQRPSILADATESVFAAVYLDGGMEEARAIIHRVLLDREREEVVEERRRDYKTALMELVQRTPGHTITYELVQELGPDHCRVFVMEVRLDGETVGRGEGRSKKNAEQAAARSALEELSK